MRPSLKVITAEGDGQIYRLADDEVLIGRKSDTDIVLIDPYISRNHAKIICHDEGYSILDLHGTFVNGEQVNRCPLKDGDRVRLGRLEMLFTMPGSDSPGDARSSPTGDDLGKSLTHLSSVLSLPEESEHSDLQKLTSILNFQYQWQQSFSPEMMFQQILKTALDISGAERGFVLVMKTSGFEYAAGVSDLGWVSSTSEFPASHSVVGQVADTGEPVFMTQGLDDQFAQQESILEMNLRAIACLPLRGISSAEDRPDLLGILYLDSTKAMHALSGLDQQILNQLASEAGNVLEKLELIKSLQEKRKYEQELTLAMETQKTLLPRSLPTFENVSIRAYSEPTRYVGGDFYDFLQPSPHQLIGVLADVSGKGVPAALLSSLLQGALDTECRSGNPLGEILNRVNSLLWKRSSPHHFVTLFLFTLDGRGKGEFVSAGHNPTYVYRAATNDIEELASDGLILGAFDFATYQSRPLQLETGDVLLVYSDGITDATSPSGDMFGEERLRKIVQSVASSGATALEQEILSSIERFTHGMAQTDDITFLLLEITGS